MGSIITPRATTPHPLSRNISKRASANSPIPWTPELSAPPSSGRAWSAWAIAPCNRAPLRQSLQLEIVALTQKQCASPQTWLTAMDRQIAKIEAIKLEAARTAHEQWWSDFWNRSWIEVSRGPAAAEVSQGYAIQRYLLACSFAGRDSAQVQRLGSSPSGTISTRRSKSRTGSSTIPITAPGECYWNQNNRLLYWPLIATGDLDLLNPWFAMYLNALPLATDRASTYYRHAGAFFPESMVLLGAAQARQFRRPEIRVSRSTTTGSGFTSRARWK
ncbi:MAG: DUF5703 domain-containing protein [Chthoniobacteraceae bacterium]